MSSHSCAAPVVSAPQHSRASITQQRLTPADAISTCGLRESAFVGRWPLLWPASDLLHLRASITVEHAMTCCHLVLDGSMQCHAWRPALLQARRSHAAVKLCINRTLTTAAVDYVLFQCVRASPRNAHAAVGSCVTAACIQQCRTPSSTLHANIKQRWQ